MRSESLRVYEYLPPHIRDRIERIACGRRGGLMSIGEIRLCAGSASSIISHGERIFLGLAVTRGEISEVVRRLCEGALYAHRETISEGYICCAGGVRVGICGQARYDGEKLVGICDVTSLVFRIPTENCTLINEMLSAWQITKRGMLIYAKPGGGKTTALRSLVSAISGSSGARIAVVDERCEFSEEECALCGVHLMRGYKRAYGIEIALRTLAPEVIVIDEIGSRTESGEMLESLGGGVKILASAHASSRDEVCTRVALSPFFQYGIFDVLVGIFNTDGTYSAKIEEI